MTAAYTGQPSSCLFPFDGNELAQAGLVLSLPYLVLFFFFRCSGGKFRRAEIHP